MIKQIFPLACVVFLAACSHGPVHQVKQKRFAGSMMKNFTKKNVGLSSIRSDGKHLFWGTSGGEVLRVNQAHKKQWATDIRDAVTTPVLVQEKHAFVGTQKGSVFCLDASSGEIVWERNYETAIRGPLISFGQHLFFLGLDGQLVAVKKSNGEIGMRKKFFMNDFFTLAFELQAAQVQGQMIFLLPNLEIISMDQNLETLWEKSFQEQFGGKVLNGFVSIDQTSKGLLVTPYMQAPFILDAQGELTESLDFVKTSAAPIVNEDEVIFIGQDHIYYLSLQDLSIADQQVYASHFPVGGVVKKDDLLFIALSNGSLDVFDAKQGQKLWTYETGSSLKGSPLKTEKAVWILNQRSQLFAFKPPYKASLEEGIKP